MIPGAMIFTPVRFDSAGLSSHLMFLHSRIGATYGSRYSIWDLSNLHGGKPNISGPGFAEGGHQFR
jgi:hypothetical protein